MALAFLRKYQRDVLLKALLGVVIVGFVLVYIPMFVQGNAAGRADEVGRVGDLPISASDYQRVYNQQRRQYEQMYRVDAATLRKMGLPDTIFDGLVDQKIVQLEAERRGLTVSDQELVRYFEALPNFQENGRFIGGQKAQRILENQGITLEEFENGLRADRLRKQLQELVTDGVSASPAEVEQEYRHRNEAIKAEYVFVDATPFKAQTTVTDEDVRAHFDGHKDDYRAPETRVVDYVRVDPESVRPMIAVTDQEIDAYYKANGEEFTEPEQACARHILFKVKGERSPTGHSAEEAAKLAAAALQQLRGGADFAALAKSSEDTGTASKGGSLGCFPRGSMVPEFEEVAFNLKQGELSDIVKTPYGYHVIRLDAHKEAATRPLTEVRDQIRASLTGSKAQTVAEAKVNAIADALGHKKKLEDAVSAAGLNLTPSAPLARGAALPPFDVKAIARIFELKVGEVEPRPLSGSLFVSLKQVTAPHMPEFADVKDRVKADLTQQKAMELARLRAADLKAKAAPAGLEQAAKAAGLTRKESQGLVHRDQPIGDLPSGSALDQAAFDLPLNTLSEPVPVTGGYAVLRVVEKKAFDPSAFEKEKITLTASEREKKRGEFFQAYLGQARQRFTIQKNADVMRRIVG